MVGQIRLRLRRDIIKVFGSDGWFLGLSRLTTPCLEELAVLKPGKRLKGRNLEK